VGRSGEVCREGKKDKILLVDYLITVLTHLCMTSKTTFVSVRHPSLSLSKRMLILEALYKLTEIHNIGKDNGRRGRIT
jgi:hypothetical protein